MATASSPPTRLPCLLHPSPSRRLPFLTQAPLHPAAAASLPSWPLQLTLTVARRRRRPAPSGATAGSEEPSEPPPPYGNGWQARLSMFQDRVRIFFAVLFWMSLFFWGSAWDGSNNSGGKKRQRFRKKYK